MTIVNLPEKPSPKINDQYWFEFSEKLITTTHETFEQIAAKIQNLVIWLWGIYTTATAVGFTLSEKQLSFWTVFPIATTSALLILLYWATVWVQFPIHVEFDPRSPTEIKDAYENSVREKNKRLRVTLVLSILAAAMVSTSLIAASFNKEKPNGAPPWFKAQILTENNNRQLAISGNSGGEEPVSIIVAPIGITDQLTKVTQVLLLPGNNGIIQTSLALHYTTPITVTLRWVDKTKTQFEMTRRVR